jgi:hypothetical protein
MSVPAPYLDIACQQVLAEDASVFSVQWADLPLAIANGLSAQSLLVRYFDYIKKCSLTLIRPITLESSVEFRVAGTRLSLLSFLAPQQSGNCMILLVSGGILVQPRRHDRGQLRFRIEHRAELIRISLQLSDFFPLLLGSDSPSPVRFWLYRLTQGAIHRLVTIRFLSELYRELSGHSVQSRVVKVSVRPGKPV